MEKGEEGEGFVLCENPLWEKKKKKAPFPSCLRSGVSASRWWWKEGDGWMLPFPGRKGR